MVLVAANVSNIAALSIMAGDAFIDCGTELLAAALAANQRRVYAYQFNAVVPGSGFALNGIGSTHTAEVCSAPCHI
jgi:hypothetical protein